MKATSSTSSIYAALLARALHHLHCGYLSPAAALQICTNSVLDVASTSSTAAATTGRYDAAALAAAFTAKFASVHVPVLTPSQTARILLDSSSSSSSSPWWLSLSGAALHQPLLAATLRRLQTCRVAVPMPVLAKAVRCSIAAAVFSSSVVSTAELAECATQRGLRGGGSSGASYSGLADELAHRLDTISNSAAAATAASGTVQEAAATAAELAHLLAIAPALSPRLIISILTFLDEVLPRLPAAARARIAATAQPWWRSVLAAEAAAAAASSSKSPGDAAVVAVSQLDLAIAKELAREFQLSGNDDDGEAQKNKAALRGPSRDLRALVKEAVAALAAGEKRADSLARRQKLVSALVALPVASSTDAFLVLRCLVLLSAWQRVLPLTPSEREALRPVLTSPAFAARVASVSNADAAAVAMRNLLL